VASSTHFAATVFTLPKIGWNAPWLWMELDMLPVKKGWLQALSQGYTLCGKPFMGNVVPTAWIESGKLVVQEDDDMMMGTGVYPANMQADQRFLPLLTNFVKPMSLKPRIPFDFYMRHAFRQAGFANTTLIADMWQTHKYRRTADGITCEPVPLDKPRRKRGGLVPPEAVLVHGCKDGTLAGLVLTGDTTKIALDAAAEEVMKSDLEEVLRNSPITKLATMAMGVPHPAPATLFGDDEQHRQAAAALVAGEAPHTEESLKAPRSPTITGNWGGEKSFSEAAAPKPAKPKRTKAPKPVTKPTVSRAAVEAARKANDGDVHKIVRALNLSLAEFAHQLPTLGYRIVTGGKLQSTQP
jgi:hypothetical protein